MFMLCKCLCSEASDDKEKEGWTTVGTFTFL